jgi:large subunit ribosomal protein L5
VTTTTRPPVSAASVQAALSDVQPTVNPLARPRLLSVTVSVGLGPVRGQPKAIDEVSATLATITGQRPAPTRAKQAIAGFKLRRGDVVGFKVTLRGKRMWEFANRLILLALPRIRDFRGLDDRGFDQQGNYAFGIREHTVFPEVHEESVTVRYGLGVVLTTTASNRADGRALMVALGLPLAALEQSH